MLSKLLLSGNSKKDESESVPLWLVTFADAMSLMLTFFVLMFSFADTSENLKIIDVEGVSAMGQQSILGDSQDLSKKNTPQGQDSSRVSGNFEYGLGSGGGAHPSDQMGGMSESDIAGVFYKGVAGMNQFADVKVNKTNTGFNIYFDFKNIFERDSVNLSFEQLKVLRDLAEILASFPNDIIIESYYVPSRVQDNRYISLYIRRMSRIAKYLNKFGGIRKERIGISESSESAGIDFINHPKKDEYSGIRLIVLEKTEGYSEFLRKAKEHVGARQKRS